MNGRYRFGYVLVLVLVLAGILVVPVAAIDGPPYEDYDELVVTSTSGSYSSGDFYLYIYGLESGSTLYAYAYESAGNADPDPGTTSDRTVQGYISGAWTTVGTYEYTLTGTDPHQGIEFDFYTGEAAGITLPAGSYPNPTKFRFGNTGKDWAFGSGSTIGTPNQFVGAIVGNPSASYFSGNNYIWWEQPATIDIIQNITPINPLDNQVIYFTQNSSVPAYHYAEIRYANGTQYHDFGYFNDTYRWQMAFYLTSMPAGDYNFHSYVHTGTAFGDEFLNFTVIDHLAPPYQTTLITATPTPKPQTCGYFDLSVNRTDVPKGQSLHAILTEEDPGDNFDKIDWYINLPTGQRIHKKSFLNDPGFFGLGAGWIEIDPITGSADVSSLNDAMNVDIDFSTQGPNILNVVIYDDKSLIRTVYSDYEEVCSINQEINVGSASYGMQTLTVQAWDSANRMAIVYGYTGKLQSLTTGAWQNKTDYYGKIYYDVIPGELYRLYVDETAKGWQIFDRTFTANPPGPYNIYFVREYTPAAENKSWITFTVFDASIPGLVLPGATITAGGQSKTTNSGGISMFELDEGTGGQYTVSKYDFFGVSGNYTVGSDDQYITVSLIRNPAIPTIGPTYPIIVPTPNVSILPTDPGGNPVPTGTTNTGGGGSGGVDDSPVARANAVNAGVGVWYQNFGFLMNLIFLVVVVGLLGLMNKSMPGGRRGRR